MPASALADVLTVYRPIRAVAPPESPWEGVLVRGPDERNLVLVDGAAWNPGATPSDADGHVVRPVDVVRRADGHDVALPPCRERVDRFLGRRRDADVPLAAGELVTLVVSLVRAGALDDALRGTWWLSDDGRPVVVPDVDADHVRHGTDALLDVLAIGADDATAEVLTRVRAANADPRRMRREAALLEDAVFALGEPAPLGTALPSRRSSGRIADAAFASAPPQSRRAARTASGGVRAACDRVIERLLPRRAGGPEERTARERPVRRRLPWLLATGLVAVVVALAAVWPTGEGTEEPSVEASDVPVPGESATSEVPMPGDSAPSDAVGPAAEPEPAAGTDPGADPVAAASAVLDERLACGGDAACLGAVLEDPAAELPAGAIDLSAEHRAVALVDDYGGVVVVRVEARDASTPPQWVTLIASDGRWWVRDVHDVADPP